MQYSKLTVSLVQQQCVTKDIRALSSISVSGNPPQLMRDNMLLGLDIRILCHIDQ